MVHMASVWVPFTSESKEAIADYDEIRKEMKLALKECGRKLGTYLRRRQKMKKEAERRSVFERYIGEIATACHNITGTDARALFVALKEIASRKTEDADQKLDQDGKVLDRRDPLEKDDDVIILHDRSVGGDNGSEALFTEDMPARTLPRRGSKAAKRTTTKKKKKTSRKR
jgi:hypothetical protein